MKILAIDYGEKRVGLALSDNKGIIAMPLPTLRVVSLAETVEKIHRIATTQNVDEIVIGLPLGPAREETQQSIKTRYFADSLKLTNITKITFWNETFTSIQAETSQNSKKKKKNLDSEAARIILQEYLDYLSENNHDLD